MPIISTTQKMDLQLSFMGITSRSSLQLYIQNIRIKVHGARTNTPPKFKTLKSKIFDKYISILKMSPTLIPCPRVGFESHTNKTTNPYKLDIQNANKTHCGPLESLSNC